MKSTTKKKLVLAPTTIRTLGTDQLERARGGAVPSWNCTVGCTR